MHKPECWNNSWWFCFCDVIHNKWEILNVCAPCHNCSASPSSGHEFVVFFLTSSFPLFCIKALLLAQVIFFRESFKASSKAVACPWDLIQTQWGGDHKEKACCDAFVCEQRKSPHYTNLFSLVHSQDTISGLQSFFNSSRREITRGKRSQLLPLSFLFFNFLFFFFLKPSASNKVTHTYIYRLQYPWQVDTLIHRSEISQRLDLKGWRQWNLPPSQSEKNYN